MSIDDGDDSSGAGVGREKVLRRAAVSEPEIETEKMKKMERMRENGKFRGMLKSIGCLYVWPSEAVNLS